MKTDLTKIKVNRIRILLVFVLCFAAGCTFPFFSQPTAVVLPTSLLIVPATLEPTSTLSPEIKAIQTPAPTVTPYRPISAVVGIKTFIVRTGPSQIFPILRTFPFNTVFSVLGQAPGNGEWVLVQTQDHLSAWAMVKYLEIQDSLNSVPFVEPWDVYKITGRVIDENGDPVQGIIFAILQGSGEDELRTEAETDTNGVFISYFPLTASGTWNVSWVSVSCQRAKVVDVNCHYSGGVQPYNQFITLPLSSPLIFTWK